MRNLLDVWRPSLENPWREMNTLQRRMDRLFDDLTNYLPSTTLADNNIDFVPACDFDETDKQYSITLDVPGMSKDQLNIELSGNTLIISGEKKEEKKEGKGANSRYERFQGSFQRSFSLPDMAAEKVVADYKDGVLHVTIPKSVEAQAKTRRIQIGEGKAAAATVKPAAVPTEKKEQKQAEKAA